MGEAERLGTLLGIMVRHGAPKVQDAIAALRQGKATPAQQKICFDIIESATR